MGLVPRWYDFHNSREDEKGFETDEAIMKKFLVTETYPGGINCYLELILVLSDTRHHLHELSFSCIGKRI